MAVAYRIDTGQKFCPAACRLNCEVLPTRLCRRCEARAKQLVSPPVHVSRVPTRRT